MPMILDVLSAVFLPIITFVMGLLPEVDPVELPGLEAFGTILGEVDTLIPILGPLQIAATVLSAVLVFVVVRFILVVVNIITW